MLDMNEFIKHLNKLSGRYPSIASQYRINQSTLQYLDRFTTLSKSINKYFQDPLALYKDIEQHKVSLANHSHVLNNNIFRYFNNIYNNLSVISQSSNLDGLVEEYDELFNSITEASDIIEETWLESNNEDINISPIPTQQNIVPNKSINWMSLIALIIAFLGLLIQISDKIDSDNSSKANIEFQNKITISVEKIDAHLEKLINNYPPK